ncbi:disulfide bond formation protein B [Neorhizobium alkalisoli]|jgi:disulfide bond formation protein DsbB|uniref:Disulfide bond formation protein DsbB n=1 Tax=Neorhizobium alkalisoli TaxID=528178 RepID=A0A561QJ14_9HYPH|nr:disulfide bond formation protein B [Neorhizobium alkalisoli]TWF50363.1 disulfide bond formation protein DsbB [Neorhizobium alkalisoli]
MALTDSIPRTKNGLVYSAVVTLGMAATVGSALAFEYLGGYMPCHLCLIERDPYYYGVPIGILGIGAAVMSLPPWVTRMILVILGIMMLIGAGIGIYHSGVEWGFWAGPSSCTSAGGSGATNAGDLLSSLNAVHGPQCDQAALRILGLSLAGWNVVASVVLAAIAFVGAKKAA